MRLNHYKIHLAYITSQPLLDEIEALEISGSTNIENCRKSHENNKDIRQFSRLAAKDTHAQTLVYRFSLRKLGHNTHILV